MTPVVEAAGTRTNAEKESMSTLTLHNIPEDLHDWLRHKARSHHRAPDEEAVVLLNTLRESDTEAPSKATLEELAAISKRCAALPVLDGRSPEEILGYADDPFGLPG